MPNEPTEEEVEAMVEKLRKGGEPDEADKLERMLAALRDEAREGE